MATRSGPGGEPPLAPGAPRAPAAGRRHGGFSLLELLLVLVIVGLIVTVTGLSVTSGGRSHALAGAVSGFARLAEYAMEEAQMGGFDLGLLLERDSPAAGVAGYRYQWLLRDGERWVPVPRDELLGKARDFPEGLELELEVEEDIVEIESRRARDGKRGPRPQVVFFGSGEATPGILRWADGDTGKLLWELEWDLVAELRLRGAGEADAL